MTVKISELTAATALTGAETFPIVQSGTTKKATLSQFIDMTQSTEESAASITPTDYT